MSGVEQQVLEIINKSIKEGKEKLERLTKEVQRLELIKLKIQQPLLTRQKTDLIIQDEDDIPTMDPH